MTVACCRPNNGYMVKLLKNRPKVAQPSNNNCVPSHSYSSNVSMCQTLHCINENIWRTACGNMAHTVALLDAIWQYGTEGINWLFSHLTGHPNRHCKLCSCASRTGNCNFTETLNAKNTTYMLTVAIMKQVTNLLNLRDLDDICEPHLWA